MAERTDDNQKHHVPSILETVSLSQQSAALRSFNPQSLITEYLEKLNPREKQILVNRYGLVDGQPQTLEEIGKKLVLTRERVRQIEKDSLKKLNQLSPPANFKSGFDLLLQIVEENGNIMREGRIFDTILVANNTPVARMGILFFLNLTQRFHHWKDSKLYHNAWYLPAFDQQLFEQVTAKAHEILKSAGKTLKPQELFPKIKSAENPDLASLSDEAVDSYLTVSKLIDKNPFDEWGLAEWADIHPKDVGDKAYLVLAHHNQPEHYAKITEMINKHGFDERVAQKETVHNELIKDKRFVLVGRGIYALASWGYKPGVVADIIEEILRRENRPLSRDEIIEYVLKQRLVKRNTIIVGLSNRDRFHKTTDNKYQLSVPKT